MQSKQYFTKIKNYPHEKSTEPQRPHLPLSKIVCVAKSDEIWLVAALVHNL